MGTLFLIPNTLGDTALETVIPSEVLRKIAAINTFASENPSNTRAFLKRITPQRTMDTVTFLEVNEHSTPEDYQACLEALARHDVGIISEAGCPGIADPGAEVVALAHQHNYPVVPLVGPSSILLALIASGFNGQNFSFNGYLPVKPEERARALRNYEKQSLLENRTQIFIETPYRNLKLFEQNPTSTSARQFSPSTASRPQTRFTIRMLTSYSSHMGKATSKSVKISEVGVINAAMIRMMTMACLR